MFVGTALIPIDPTVAEEKVTFDFGPGLDANVSIIDITSITCTPVSGTDGAPATRLLGSPKVIPSPKTGATGGAVQQLVGNMLPGVVYQLQCVVATSDEQELSMRWNLPCGSPPGQ